MAPRLNGTTTRVRVSGPCAVAHLPAAERRLMVTPPSTKKGQKRRIHCLVEGISRNILSQKDGESREKHDGTKLTSINTHPTTSHQP